MAGKGRVDLADSEAMDEFIESLDHLNEEQLLGLNATWRSEDPQAREDAWTRVRATAAVGGLLKEVQRVRDRALDWATRAPSIPYPYAIDGHDRSHLARREAAPALVDAAIAIALGDRLDESTRDVLLGPWLRVTDQG